MTCESVSFKNEWWSVTRVKSLLCVNLRSCRLFSRLHYSYFWNCSCCAKNEFRRAVSLCQSTLSSQIVGEKCCLLDEGRFPTMHVRNWRMNKGIEWKALSGFRHQKSIGQMSQDRKETRVVNFCTTTELMVPPDWWGANKERTINVDIQQQPGWFVPVRKAHTTILLNFTRFHQISPAYHSRLYLRENGRPARRPSWFGDNRQASTDLSSLRLINKHGSLE